jgi:putative ABC transport system ATP-binding protein
VDAAGEARIIERLHAVCRDVAGVLVATHIAAVAAAADRVLHIKDGRIVDR